MDLFVLLGNNKGVKEGFIVMDYTGGLKEASDYLSDLLDLETEGSHISWNELNGMKYGTVDSLTEAFNTYKEMV